MQTKTIDQIVKELSEPFPKDSIHWRVGATNRDKTKAIALAYLDARDVMDRLDKVVGPSNWQNAYQGLGCCGIGIKDFETGEWLWRWNGAGETKVEAEKGQASDSFKRAAVLFGIGRYLYALPNVWCRLDNGRLAETPSLPAWALPEAEPVNPEELDHLVITIEELIDNTPELAAMVKTDAFAAKMKRLQSLDGNKYDKIKARIVDMVKKEKKLDDEIV